MQSTNCRYGPELRGLIRRIERLHRLSVKLTKSGLDRRDVKTTHISRRVRMEEKELQVSGLGRERRESEEFR